MSRKELPQVHAFYERLYLKHIQLWNNYFEEEPLKQSRDDFLKSFKNLIDSIEKNGFDKTRPILIGYNGDINTGSHRLATCFSFGKDIAVKFSKDIYKYDYTYFLENKKISTDLADINALEYVKVNPHAFIVNIFPVMPVELDSIVETILMRYGFVYYKKCLDITLNACLNLKRINYGKQEWLREHAEKSMGLKEQGKLRVYIFVCHNYENVCKAKKEIRSILNIGNYPVHINDEKREGIELVQTYFNENSWYMVNKRPYNLNSEKLDLFLNEFKNYIFSNNYKNDYFCAAGSTPLAVFGIRDIEDFDFLHIYEEISKPKHEKLSSHEAELKNYPFSKEEIILDPKNHFYYKGIKFISLEVLMRMKEHRNEIPKDVNDVQKIKEYLSKQD